MHEPTAAYGEVDFAISSQLETEIAQFKKKRTLEIRCLGLIEGGIPPPRVTWVIALKQVQSPQRVLAQTNSSTAFLDTYQLRRRIEESSFIPRFIPKRGQAIQEAVMGAVTASHSAVAWLGPVSSLREGAAETSIPPGYWHRQLISNPSLLMGSSVNRPGSGTVDSHLWPGDGRRRNPQGSHR